MTSMTTLEVLQLCLIGQRSGRIDCAHSEFSGTLYVESGQVIHAECGQSPPEDAFYQLVVVSHGEGSFTPSEQHPPRTIFRPTDFLLMEAARLADEKQRKSNKPITPAITQLTVISDPIPKVFELSEDRITVGRGLDNVIILSVESVSGHHCLIERRDQDFWISDSQSRNGTFVNNRRITDPIQLQPGDLIQLGAALLRCGTGEITPAGGKHKTSRMHQADTQDLRPPPRPHATEGTIRFQVNTPS